MISSGVSTAAGTDPVFREPELGDGADFWKLARDSGTLELNSAYVYLLWCHRFADTSILAELDGQAAGFVCGFRPQRQSDTLFIWQVAVSKDHRGMGLAGRMITSILDRDPGLRYLEATVTPSNEASRRLFRSIARSRNCSCEESPYFRPQDFPGGDHEAEHLFRIGPLESTNTDYR